MYFFFTSGSEYSILFHRKNTEDYVIAKGATQMTAITACFWIKTWLEQYVVLYISYALDEARDNEFGIRTISSNLDLYVKYYIHSGRYPSQVRYTKGL